MLVAATAVLGAGVAAHFTAVFLHVAPLNPVSLRLSKPVDDYISPFFVQNWQLFAPTPVNSDGALLVRARVADDSTGRVRETGYLDITTPAIREHQRRRLWPSKRAHLTTSVLQLVEHTDPIAEKVRTRIGEGAPLGVAPSDEPAAELPISPEEREIRKFGERIVTRLASHAARAEWGSGVRDVQVRVAHYAFPRFSQRQRSRVAGATSVYDLPWVPAQEVAR